MPDNEPAPGVLVTIGDLVEDVVVWSSGPVRHATDNASTITRARGGSAANVAVFAAATGVPTRFLGRVGADPLGELLVAELTRAGVEARVQRTGRTGTIMILVDDAGERTMFPDRAAAAELADAPRSWVHGAGMVHAPGYCFATPASAATTVDLLRTARAAGALISLDAASESLLQQLGTDALPGTRRFLDIVAELAPDYLFANAAEAAELGLADIALADIALADTALADTALPHTVVLVKHGSGPVEVRVPDRPVTTMPVAPVDVVRDTTGAGDAFAAGCLSALLRGADLPTAVTRGTRLAAAVLGSAGATLAPGAGITPNPLVPPIVRQGAH